MFQSAYGMTDVDSLRYALFICAFVYIISFFNYFNAAKYLGDDLKTAEREAESNGSSA